MHCNSGYSLRLNRHFEVFSSEKPCSNSTCSFYHDHIQLRAKVFMKENNILRSHIFLVSNITMYRNDDTGIKLIGMSEVTKSLMS